MASTTLYHCFDPMCSFCWAFRPSWDQFKQQLPKAIQQPVEIVNLVGGLAPDSDDPMPEAMQRKLQGIWRHIAHSIAGTPFNFDFWEQCQPRRSTYPTCRAILACRELAPEKEDDLLFGIQSAYYLCAKNPSNLDTLIEVASHMGIEANDFADQISGDDIEIKLQLELQFARSLGMNSFPSLVLKNNDSYWNIPIDYHNPASMIKAISSVL